MASSRGALAADGTVAAPLSARAPRGPPAGRSESKWLRAFSTSCDRLPVEGGSPEYGSGSTLHRYFQQWTAAGVFRKLWKASLLEYDELKGIQWNWQSVDGAMTKSPLGGEKYGQKPDRSRQAGHEAFGAHRRTRRPVGRGGERGQHARHQASQSDFRQRPHPSARSPPLAVISTSASTRGTTRRTFASFSKRRHYRPHVKSRGQEESQRKKNHAIQSPTMGRRTNAFLDQSLPATPCPLGERNPTTISPCCNSPSPGQHAQHRRSSGIGSKSNSTCSPRSPATSARYDSSSSAQRSVGP